MGVGVGAHSYAPAYVDSPSSIQSTTRSAIMMVVAFVLARTTSGMMEASTTRSPFRPWSRQY